MPSKTETQDRSFCLRRDWCRDTDLICTNGKRDSGAKLTSPEFLRTICLNRGPTGLPMQLVNNSPGGGGALGYFLGGCVPPGTKIDTPFQKWAKFLYPFLEFALKLIPRSRNGPNFYIPFQKVCKLKQPRFLKKIFLYLFDLYIK